MRENSLHRALWLLAAGMVLAVGWPADAWSQNLSRADVTRFLEDHGLQADTANLVAYLQRWRPGEARQQEINGWLAQLSAPEFTVREQAFKQLQTYGEAARAALIQAGQCEDPEASWRSRKLLERLNSSENARVGKTVDQAALRWLKMAGDPAACASLLEILPALPDDSRRADACEALWACCRPEHVERIREALSADSLEVQAAALVALEVAGGASGEEEIAKRLASEHPRLRLAAARALLDRRPRRAIDVLIALTAEEDPEIVSQADALLRLKTMHQPALNERRELHDVWREWVAESLAQAELPVLGALRLELHAGRSRFIETFDRSQESLGSGYGRFDYETTQGGASLVEDGRLKLVGDQPETDQRLVVTAQRLLGQDVWPGELEVTTRLAGETGNNFGWHLGVSIGRVKTLFHPGVQQGAFRAETTDTHEYLLQNESMGFEVATDTAYRMTIHVVETETGADFEVTVQDEAGEHRFQREFSVTREQLGKFDRIGLERSGRAGGSAWFDSVEIRVAP